MRNYDRIKEISKDFRPVLVISSDEQNQHGGSVVTLPFTSDLSYLAPTEVKVVKTPFNGLEADSKIICNRPFAWDKELRFKEKLGEIDFATILAVKKAWKLADLV